MRRRIELILAIFFVSGIGGLIYESVWTHYVKLFLGHAAYAQTLVLVVFIGGLALGSWLCSRVAARIRNPLRVYAAVEGIIGLLALGFHRIFELATSWGYSWLLPATCEPASTFCAAQWLLAAALLAPQSILLGATFPLVSSAVLRLSAARAGHDISTLYFLNSLGAVLGVLASAFVLIPAVGLPGTLMAAGLANIGVAIAAYLVSKYEPAPLVAAPLPDRSPGSFAPDGRGFTVLMLATAFLTGLSSFVYEIGWIRMLGLVLGSSTHAFEIMLASFILGLALGGLWVRHRIDSASDPVRLLAYIQLLMGLAAAATIPVYNGIFDLMAWLLSSLARTDGGYFFFNLASTAIALVVMLPATFCAGMTLPLITYRLLRSPTGERSLGLVYSANTLGAIVGVILAVHLLLEWAGLALTIVVGASVDVALGVWLLMRSGPGGRRGTWPAFAALLLLAVLVVSFDIDPKRSASGVFRTGIARLGTNDQVLFHRDGKTATVDVVGGKGVRAIRTNGKPDAALTLDMNAAPTGDEHTMMLLAVLPLGHHPEARTAAVIGFGSGMSTAALLASPRLQRVDTIEIEPAMVEGAKLFRPVVEAAYSDPRSRIVIDDAKSYFARGRERYDIIVSEPSNPWVSGVASLFTKEFYQRLSGYMNEGAVLSQWLHTYEMDAATLSTIMLAVAETFPDFVVYAVSDSDLVLIARKGLAPGTFDAKVLELPALSGMLRKIRMTEPEVVTRRVLGPWKGLEPIFSRHATNANSDYFPIVDLRASKTRFIQANADELTRLQGAPVPMLEMLAGSPMASAKRADGPRVSHLDRATDLAWRVRAIALDDAAGAGKSFTGSEEVAAWMLLQWSRCAGGLSFAQALPALVSVAQAVNPFLAPAAAGPLWSELAGSRCARQLRPEERVWIDLAEATAGRDAAAMARVGSEILARLPADTPDTSSEFAFFATAVGHLCQGDAPAARALLEKGAGRWVRRGSRLVEIEYLDALTRPRGRGAMWLACAAGASPPAAPARQGGGR